MIEKPVDILPENEDDHLMAAVSHAMILFPSFGIFIALAIWLTQRKKSRYVAFQSLQAIFYQIAFWLFANSILGCGILATFGFPISVCGLAFGLSFFDIDPASLELDPAVLTISMLLKLIPLVILGLLVILVFALIAHALYGAIKSLSGKPFKYIFIGRLLEKKFVHSDIEIPRER